MTATVTDTTVTHNSGSFRRTMRVGVVVLAAVALAGAVIVVARPAHATKYQTLSVKPGQTVSKTFPAIPAFNRNQGHQVLVALPVPYPPPSVCDSPPDSAWCDDIPVSIDVPAATFAKHSYTVLATVDWNTTSVNTAVGPQQENQLDIYFWENPPAAHLDGGPAADASVEGTPPPATATVVSPASQDLNLQVWNSVGVNTGYTVTIQVLDNGTAVQKDLSVDTGGVPVDKSNTSNIPVTPDTTPVDNSAAPSTPETTTPPPTLPPAPTSSGGVPLNSVAPTPDPQLVSLASAANPAIVGLGPAKHVSHSAAAKTGPPGPASSWELTIALLILPLVLVAASVVGWRRRAAATAVD